jgi:hypothetical protein
MRSFRRQNIFGYKNGGIDKKYGFREESLI